jgi:hypothetical protein
MLAADERGNGSHEGEKRQIQTKTQTNNLIFKNDKSNQKTSGIVDLIFAASRSPGSSPSNHLQHDLLTSTAASVFLSRRSREPLSGRFQSTYSTTSLNTKKNPELENEININELLYKKERKLKRENEKKLTRTNTKPVGRGNKNPKIPQRNETNKRNKIGSSAAGSLRCRRRGTNSS